VRGYALTQGYMRCSCGLLWREEGTQATSYDERLAVTDPVGPVSQSIDRRTLKRCLIPVSSGGRSLRRNGGRADRRADLGDELSPYGLNGRC